MRYEMKECDRGDRELIAERLEEYNYTCVPPEEGASEETAVFRAADGGGNIIGGCIVCFDVWNVADFDILWVDERYRGKGLGSALLREAERAARERDCAMIAVGTFDFQARPFYEKHGYTLCGTNEDWPKGHEYYYLVKRLDGEAAAADGPAPAFGIVRGTEEDGEFIEDRLHEYNVAALQIPDEGEALCKKLVDRDGRLIAGIAASVDTLRTGYVDVLWVEEGYRNQGLGFALLRDFEHEAKKRGCYAVLADNAYTWQAEFFKKHGYAPTGVFEDWPKGYTSFPDMKKLL